MRDIRMRQRRCCARFLQEANQPLLVARHVDRKDLQGGHSIQLRVAGQIHLAHPALANLRADFVAAEFGSGTKSHYSVVVRPA